MSDEQKTWTQKWGPHLLGLAAIITAASTAASSCEWLKPDRVAALFGTLRQGDEVQTSEINSILTDIQVSVAKIDGRMDGLEKRMSAAEVRIDRVLARSGRHRPTSVGRGPAAVVEAVAESPPPPGCSDDGDCGKGGVCRIGECIQVKTVKAKLPTSLEQAIQPQKLEVP